MVMSHPVVSRIWIYW